MEQEKNWGENFAPQEEKSNGENNNGEGNKEQNKPLTGEKVCEVVLEELKKQGIDITQEKFLKEWNERIERGAHVYNKVDPNNLKEEISETAEERLSWYLESLLLPLKSYLKIYEKLGRKIDPAMVDYTLKGNLIRGAKNTLENEKEKKDLIERAIKILAGDSWDENSENADYLIEILKDPEAPLSNKKLVAEKFNGDINKLPLDEELVEILKDKTNKEETQK